MAVTVCSSLHRRTSGMPRRPKRARCRVTFTAGLSVQDREGRQRDRSASTVTSAFLGVGAPEAALVGVVALVVFGPQGLIDAAKAAAAAIRSFQPAIQEISQASTEIRSTITNEMGIESLQKEFQEISRTTRDSLSLSPAQTTSSMQSPAEGTYNGGSSTSTQQIAADGNRGSFRKGESDESVIATMPKEIDLSPLDSPTSTAPQIIDEDPDLERKRADSAALAWGGSAAVSHAQQSTPLSSSALKRLEDMTVAELEQELERRKRLIQAIDNLNA